MHLRSRREFKEGYLKVGGRLLEGWGYGMVKIMCSLGGGYFKGVLT